MLSLYGPISLDCDRYSATSWATPRGTIDGPAARRAVADFCARKTPATAGVMLMLMLYLCRCSRLGCDAACMRFSNIYDRIKSLWIFNGQLAEQFAIDNYLGLAQSVDESTVLNTPCFTRG